MYINMQTCNDNLNRLARISNDVKKDNHNTEQKQHSLASDI